MGHDFDRDAVSCRGDDIEGALGHVVGAREVHENDPRDARVFERSRDGCRLFVGKMPERARDPPAQPQRVRANLQHSGAVVRLDERQIALREKAVELAGRMAKIGGDTEAPRARRDADGDLRGVVRDDQRFDDERSERNGSSRDEGLDLSPPPGSLERGSVMGPDGNAQCPSQGQRMSRVVSVVVRDDQPQWSARGDQVTAQRAHFFGRARRVDARVDDDALSFGFNDDAVAARAAAENENAQWDDLY